MKKVDEPPLIILMDLLFILIFFLILSDDKSISIHLDENYPEYNAIYLYEDSQANIRSVSTNEIFVNEESILVNCNKYIYCEKYINSEHKNIYLYLPKEIFLKISKISYHAFASKVANCTNLDLYINNKGKLNFEKIYTKNLCLKNIKNFEKIYH